MTSSASTIFPDEPPNICKVAPSSRFHMQDVLRAGGVSAIIHEIARIPGALHLDAMTVSGKTLGETVEGCGIADETVIHPLENAYSRDGGLAILFGNLAEEGAVVKKGGCASGYDEFPRARRDFRVSGRGL